MDVVLGVATIGGFVLAMFVFWPRVALSMLADPDPLVWNVLVNNESYLPLRDLDADFRASRLVLAGSIRLNNVQVTGITGGPLRKLKPGEQHVLQFDRVIGGAPVPVDDGALISIEVRYRYLRTLKITRKICFESSSPRGGATRWLPVACPDETAA